MSAKGRRATLLDPDIGPTGRGDCDSNLPAVGQLWRYRFQGDRKN